ncbi:MAG: aminotransferase class I/II-fold pyridoxal phosphate-dependent enzyme [Chthoniobacterales bacterium]
MKTTLNDLAMFGGTPAFKEALHVGRPNLGDRATFLDRINQILDSRWLSNMGPQELEFEDRVANTVGVEHCVAMCNATVALEIAIRSLDLKGEVIVPSFTFVATAHALQWQRVTPVFCDIDPNTHNLDPAKVEAMITPQTSGILGVHLWGRPCDTTALQAIANKHRLKLLFDAAHAFGCSYGGKQIGGFGDAEILSFHATKFVNSFEGGAVVTNNAELAAQIRLMRNFGFCGYDEVTQLGINGKMSEVCAAMGLTSLEAMDTIVEVNRRNWKAYREGLMGLPGISLLEYDNRERNNYHYVVIEVDSTRAALERDQLLELLHKENVLARRYFWPGCHRMEPYKSLYPNAHLSLAQTERVAAQIITLPTGQTITPEMIGKICSIIRMAFENAPAIRGVLKEKPKG